MELWAQPTLFTGKKCKTIQCQAIFEREREIKFIGLFEDRGHRGPYSQYKLCNHIFEPMCINCYSNKFQLNQNPNAKWFFQLNTLENVCSQFVQASLSYIFPFYLSIFFISYIPRKISNIRCTKSKKLNVSRLVLQLSMPNSLRPGVKSRMKM